MAEGEGWREGERERRCHFNGLGLGVCQRLASLPATSKQLGSVLLVSLPSSRLPQVNGFGVFAVVMATGPDSR